MRIAICDDELRYRRMIHEKLLQDSICHDYEAEISEYASGAELLAAMERGYRFIYSAEKNKRKIRL